MATVADYLTTARLNAAARLAELDTVPVDQRMRGTYTSKTGQSIDWNAYRRELLAEIRDLNSLIVQSSPPHETWV